MQGNGLKTNILRAFEVRNFIVLSLAGITALILVIVMVLYSCNASFAPENKQQQRNITVQELYSLAENRSDSLAITKLLKAGKTYDEVAKRFNAEKWIVSTIADGVVVLVCITFYSLSFLGICTLIGTQLIKTTKKTSHG